MANYTGHRLDPTRIQPLEYPGVETTLLKRGWNFEWGEVYGASVTKFTGWNVNWDENWNSPGIGFFLHQNTVYEGSVGPEDGPHTVNQPIMPRGFSFTGYHGTGFGDVFYNRILIEPLTVDFGSIVSDQQIDVEVFNAFLTNVTLSDLIETNFDSGLNVTGDPTPDVYFPLEEKTYVVQATLNGPPQTAAILTFDWLAPIADISVIITGSRIVLLPVTYRDKVKETLMFKTNVLNSYNGTEQRVMVRQNPRHRLSIKAYLNKEDRFRVENLIYGWRNRIWAIPMWPDARRADPITVNDMTIYLDTTYADFRVDYLAVIWESSRKFDVFQIASKTDTSLTLDRGVNDTYDNPIVMPVRSARMVKDPRRKTTGYDATLETILEVTDNLAYPAAASAIQFNGEDTFFMEPLQTTNDGAPDTYQHRIDLMDNTTGVIEQFSPWNFIRINREFELILEGSRDIWEMREWLYRRAGKLRPFYMPTYENNLRLISTGTILDSFVVEEDAYSTQSTARNHIAVLLTDGSYLFRTIIASEINVDGNTDITIDSPLGVQADEIDEINYFGLKRLTSDNIDITWMPNNVVSIVLPITELEP